MDRAITPLETTPDERAAHILRLRHLAIELIGKSGRWEPVGNTPVMVTDHANLSITYMTPFQRGVGCKELLGYALSICAGENELLSLVWNTTGVLLIEGYEPGEWETLLRKPVLTASLAA